jgi:hypothetical protein
VRMLHLLLLLHHLLLLLHLLLHRANLGLRAEVEQRDGEVQRAAGRDRADRAVLITERRRDGDLVLAALLHAGQRFRKARNDLRDLHRRLFVGVEDGAIVELAFIFHQHDVGLGRARPRAFLDDLEPDPRGHVPGKGRACDQQRREAKPHQPQAALAHRTQWNRRYAHLG